MKTEEEIYEYVLNFKNNMLRSSNQEKARMFDRANDIDARLNSHLITLAALLFTIIGGLITSGAVSLSNSQKTILALASISFLISLGFGLVNYFEIANFWTKWARAEHEKGRMIYEDNSETVEKLKILVEKVMEKSEELPQHTPMSTRVLQVGFFVIGLALLFVLFVFILQSH